MPSPVLIFTMSQINNSELTKEIMQGAKLFTNDKGIPTQLAEKVVPVMEVNPKMFRRINIVKTNDANNAVNVVIYTTPTDRDFFLTGAYLSMNKDATATSAYTQISATIEEGTSITLIFVRGYTLVAQSENIYVPFSNPIKLKRGTAINLSNSTNVANISSTGIIYGYTVAD